VKAAQNKATATEHCPDGSATDAIGDAIPAKSGFRAIFLLVILACLPAAARGQQFRRLPPVGPSVQYRLGDPRAEQHVDIDAMAPVPVPTAVMQPQLGPALEESIEEAQPAGPPGAKPGVFQGVAFQFDWMPDLEGGDLDIKDFTLTTTWGFPLPTRDSPLLITPGFGAHLLDGPPAPDLPGELYDAYLQFRWLRPITDRWSADLAVTTGVYGDLQSDNNETFRVSGRAMAIFRWRPGATLIFGVVILNRNDIFALPAAGLIWQPNDLWDVNLVFPQPRIARRILRLDHGHVQHRVYLAGEFGGGRWAIQRADGSDDAIDVSDYRLMLGLEKKRIGGLRTRVELGYVFSRTIEFDSATPDFTPADTLLLRVATDY